ncbi:MAG: glycosyltransferase family 39 protein [Deltaproteobacteria bacterium]|nr:glycosyltransferase family 39 protein [Deltaproteobacteria bacterium]
MNARNLCYVSPDFPFENSRRPPVGPIRLGDDDLDAASSSRRWILAALLVTGVVLRFWCFSGLVGSDDLSYAHNAHALLEGAYQPIASPLSNRIGHIGLIAFFFGVLGVSEYALIASPLLFSMLQIVLAYAFLHRIGRPRAALIAAGYLAVAPWDVVFATRGYPDLPSAALFAAFVTLLLVAATARGRSRTAIAFGAGLCLGAAYLVKEMVILQMLYWAPALLWVAWREKQLRIRDLAAAGIGAVCVVLGEGIGYYAATGDFLFRFHGVDTGYNQTVWSGTALYQNLVQRVFVIGPRSLLFDNVYLMGFALGPILYLGTSWKDRPMRLILGWLLFDIAYFVAGSSSLTAYNPLPLFRRYMLMMAFPAALLIGVGLDRWWADRRDPARAKAFGTMLAAAAVVIALGAVVNRQLLIGAAAGCVFAAAIVAFVRRPTVSVALAAAGSVLLLGAGLKEAYPTRYHSAWAEHQLHAALTDSTRPVFADGRTIEILRFFNGYRDMDRYRDLFRATRDDVRNALVVVNEPRVAFAQEHYGDKLPEWIRGGPPPGFRLVSQVGGDKPGEAIFLFYAP